MLRLLKLRPLLTSSSLRVPPKILLTPTTPIPIPTPIPLLPAHCLLPRLPVSGTPKGKARLKSVAALKKKSFQKNKLKSPLDPKSKSRGGPLAPKSRSLPIRLNSKLRRRESLRQELGLQSKLHSRDLQLRKAREGPPRPFMGLEGIDLVQLGLVDGDSVPRFEMTVEDGRRLAKEYSRVIMRWNRMRQVAEGHAMELMREAVEAMPEDLRKKALVPVVKRKKKARDATGRGKKKGGAKGHLKVVSGKKPGAAAGKKGGGKGGKK